MNQSRNVQIDFIAKLIGLITATINLLIAMPSLSKLWQGDTEQSTLAMLTIGTLCLTLAWFCCLYFAFKRTPPLIEQGEGTWQYPRLRLLSIVGLIVIPVLTVTSIGYYFYQQAQPPAKAIILVANFDGPDPQKYRVTETILARLHSAVDVYNDVQIQALGYSITEMQGSSIARAVGENNKAVIVIWGWYGVTSEVVSLGVHFEVIRAPKNMPKFSAEATGAVRISEVAEIESFTLQTNLSDEMAYLSLFTVGMARYRISDWNEAIRLFNDALFRAHSEIRTLDRSIVYDYRGLAYINKGDYVQGLLEYDRILNLGVNRPNVYYNRGLLFYLKGDLDRAIAEYNTAINLRPNYTDAFHNRGVCYAEKGDYDRAIADYTQAIWLRQDLAPAYGNRGISYARKGDLDRAIADYTQFIALDDDDPKIFYLRGSAHLDKQNYDQAVNDLTQSIRLKPDNAVAYSQRGFAYAGKRDYDKAIGDFSQVIRLKPKDAEAYNNRGICYFYKQDFDRALADLNQALVLDPIYAGAYFNRGNTYTFKKENDKAIADFKMFLKLSQDPEWRKLAESRLKVLESR